MNQTPEFDVSDDARRAVDQLRQVARHGIWWADPVELYDLLGCLVEVTHTTRVLAHQAAQCCHGYAVMPELCVDDLGQAVAPSTVAQAAARNARLATAGFDHASGDLRAAHSGLARLYLDPTGERT